MKNQTKILVIDDDVDICNLLKMYLQKHDFHVDTAHSGNTAKIRLKESSYDLVLCDFRLPDIDGLELVMYIRQMFHNTQVIIITGYSDVKMAVKVIKRGAADYVTKPIHPEEILLSIKNALAKRTVIEEQDIDNQSSKKKKKKKKKKKARTNNHNFLRGTSASSKELYGLVDLVAPTDMSVIILGESGTGKEVMARHIHNLSERSDEKFVAVDCGALPKEIAGSELFGHKKGSFTGAVADKIGHFQEANGGTLFLDEIGNLSYENQIKLLRVLQERTIKPIGDVKDIKVDVRVLAATNDDLQDKVRKGEFREDLFYRLNEFKINLKPLRERSSEISDFTNFMLEITSEELNLEEPPSISKETLKAFKEYYWPGNIRELKNIIKRCVLLSQGSEISVDLLPDVITKPQYFIDTGDSDSELSYDGISSLKDVVEKAEKQAIISVLKSTSFNKTKAAKILQVDRKTLYNKMNAFGLE